MAHAGDNLTAALARYGIDVDADRIERLDRYCRVLWSWNDRLNLTRHVTYEKFAARDVVDSLALAEWIESNARVLDVGTGGGVPGIVLAILRPDLEMSLCEPVGKKLRAVQAILAELALSAQVYRARVEQLLATAAFPTLVARAVAPLPRLLGWLRPHTNAFDRLLVVKSRSWEAECRAARAQGLLESFELSTLSTYRTPGSGAMNIVGQVRPKGHSARGGP